MHICFAGLLVLLLVTNPPQENSKPKRTLSRPAPAGASASGASTSPCGTDHDFRTDKKRGIVANGVILEGTRGIDTAEMSSIVGAISDSCFDEQEDAVATYVSAEFLQRGYLLAKVEHVRIDIGDALAVPKPATIHADVTEGPQYHLGELRFQGNKAFSDEKLKGVFPLKAGGVFNLSRVRGGLGALRALYGSAGYVDADFSPQWEIQSVVDAMDSPKALIKISVNEGKQYHMGKLQVLGSKPQADALEIRWALQEGTPFDVAYLHKFVQDSRAELPGDFNEQEGLRTFRNCRDATVTVTLILDWRETVGKKLSDTDCEKPKSLQP